MSKVITNQSDLEEDINKLLRLVSFDRHLSIFMPGLLALRYKVGGVGVDTACTDGYTVWCGLDYWNSQTPPQRVGILFHEMAHCLWLHFYRFIGADMSVANAACDFVVNRFVRQLAKVSTNIDMMSAPPGCSLYDSDEFGDDSEEIIYNELIRRREEGEMTEFQPSPGAFTEPDPDSLSQGDSDGDGDESDESDGDPSGSSQGEGHGKEGGSDGQPNEGQPQRPNLVTEWEQIMEKIVQMARLSGNMPAGFAEMLEKKQSVLDWYSILLRFLLSCSPEDFSEDTFDRRFMSSGIYLEAVDKPVMDSAVCVVDTSGSMNSEWLVQSKSEIQHALRSVGIKRCWVMDNDANIAGGVVEYGPRDDIAFVARGRGGTDFRPPFEWVRDQCPTTPACLIFFTDGDGPFPASPPPYPVLWVTFGKPPSHYPFGDVLDLRHIRK